MMRQACYSSLIRKLTLSGDQGTSKSAFASTEPLVARIEVGWDNTYPSEES
jgi:hypothetical protein